MVCITKQFTLSVPAASPLCALRAADISRACEQTASAALTYFVSADCSAPGFQFPRREEIRPGALLFSGLACISTLAMCV